MDLLDKAIQMVHSSMGGYLVRMDVKPEVESKQTVHGEGPQIQPPSALALMQATLMRETDEATSER